MSIRLVAAASVAACLLAWYWSSQPSDRGTKTAAVGRAEQEQRLPQPLPPQESEWVLQAEEGVRECVPVCIYLCARGVSQPAPMAGTVRLCLQSFF